MRRCTTLLFLAGCGFSSGAGPDAGPSALDAPITPMIDAAVADAPAPMPDAAVCAAGVVDICGLPAPTMPFDVTSAATLNTDSDTHCKTVTVAGHNVCLIYATEVTITATLTVIGGRPLALVSASTMMVTSAIDASSRGAQIGPGADDPSCAFATNPESDIGGAGGGAGGSLTLAGGNGGIGDSNDGAGGDGTGLGGTHGATVSTPPPLRGGCRGQKGGDEKVGGGAGGAGGHSGGALYLAARQSVTVTNSIRATGAGGAGGQVQAGGGGGGAGGMVVIESASITVTGQISANGGGGGQGGGRVQINPAMTRDVTGGSGNDGALGMTPAAGGSGANNNDPAFSTGGAGGAGNTAAGPGTSSVVGGGGGGGAAGVVRLIGTTHINGAMISPPPS